MTSTIPSFSSPFPYIGNKSFLKNKLRDVFSTKLLNSSVNKYVEFFAGSLGSLSCVVDILHQNNIKSILLNDINKPLMGVYSAIISGNIELLITTFNEIEAKFHSLINHNKIIFIAKNSKSYDEKKMALKDELINANSYFYSVRNEFNDMKDECNILNAATFLFLQHHCFNGIYRENGNGKYNAPFNWEARDINDSVIRAKLYGLKESVFDRFNVELMFGDFRDISEDSYENSLIYLDPPYIKNCSSENKYSKSKFGYQEQMDLIEKISDCNFIYSNHDNNDLINKFHTINQEIKIELINRKNVISSNKETRGNDIKELLISSI